MKHDRSRRIGQMTPAELTDYTRAIARDVERMLPPGPSAKGRCLFFILFTDESRMAQYASNADRDDCIKLLRETADRLENRQTDERVPFAEGGNQQ